MKVDTCFLLVGRSSKKVALFYVVDLSGWPSDEEMLSSNPADHFQWLSKDQLCILVYLVTVMHSMQVSFSLFS